MFVAASVQALFAPDRERAPTRTAHVVTGCLYAGLGLGPIAALRVGPEGLQWVISALVITWANDTCAYFAGRLLGRHKLHPSVSPNKTWEGFAGGVVGSVAGMFVAWRLLWESLGREVLRISADTVVLRREILRIGRSRTFPSWAVRDFRVGRFNEDPIYPLWSRLFVGKGPCYLSFFDGQREVHFGRGMSEADAAYLIDRMKDGRREAAASSGA